MRGDSGAVGPPWAEPREGPPWPRLDSTLSSSSGVRAISGAISTSATGQRLAVAGSAALREGRWPLLALAPDAAVWRPSGRSAVGQVAWTGAFDGSLGSGRGIGALKGAGESGRDTGSTAGPSGKSDQSVSHLATGVLTIRWSSGAVGSKPGSGAQERHAPALEFQHLSHAYCRHVMQKLKVRWKASVARVESSCSSSCRA
jgi:hypothetical protein